MANSVKKAKPVKRKITVGNKKATTKGNKKTKTNTRGKTKSKINQKGGLIECSECKKQEKTCNSFVLAKPNKPFCECGHMEISHKKVS